MIVGEEEAAGRLAELIEKVNDDRIAVHIASPGGRAVLVAEEDVAAWQETLYLRRSSADLLRLRESIADGECERSEDRPL